MSKFVVILFLSFTVIITRAQIIPDLAQGLSNIPLLGNLESILSTEGSANIFITLAEGPEQILNNVLDQTLGDRGSQITSMTNDLKDLANRTQQVVMDVLNKFVATTGTDLTIKQYWITNQIYVKGATSPLIVLLQALGSVIGSIQEESFAGFGPIEPEVASYSEDEYTWGMEKIEAPGAWELQKSLRSNHGPVIVASIDSGVRHTHAELADSYVGGEYGWYDPVEETPLPNDGIGHGTHTMGTIVGKNIGVAPNAKWMSCKGCQGRACAQSDVLSCGQFLLCPTKTDGSDPDCSKAPRIINNSWGNSNGNDPSYAKMVAAWRSAGIIPIFSVGNSGPGCGSANSPGDYDNVISVGSSNVRDELSKFSSRGPAGRSSGGRIKPDISAPGESILSAWHTGDNDYRKISGTSMAAPHVTGVVALMFETRGKMTFDQVKSALLQGATQDGKKPSGRICEHQGYKFRFPNNEFGQGILNAKNSVGKATS